MIHPYSLSHDDLPSWMRRTARVLHCHIDLTSYPISPGDALQTLAFQIIAEIIALAENSLLVSEFVALPARPEECGGPSLILKVTRAVTSGELEQMHR